MYFDPKPLQELDFFLLSASLSAFCDASSASFSSRAYNRIQPALRFFSFSIPASTPFFEKLDAYPPMPHLDNQSDNTQQYC